MAHSVSWANWNLEWEIPSVPSGGIVIRRARFGGRMVLWEGSQPFVLVPYHTGSPEYKDGRTPACGGVALTMLVPFAPNSNSARLEARHFANNDGAFDPVSNKKGAVWVVKSPRSFTEPETLVLTAKFGVGNYQYVHRWEFRADGAIHPQVGLAGELYPGDKSRPHVHNFYYRLDLDILSHGNNVVEKFEHRSQAGGLATDRWIPIPTESAHRFEPDKFTRWRVRHRTESNANSRPRSYEIIPGSDGGPDGHFSTADFWLVDRRVGAELGDEVLCTDRILTTSYATGAPPQPFDSVVWVCLRVHHHPRESGEETKVVPYHFSGFHIEPRDFLDATPTALYSTDPASP